LSIFSWLLKKEERKKQSELKEGKRESNNKLLVHNRGIIDSPDILEDKLHEHGLELSLAVVHHSFCLWIKVVISPESLPQGFLLDPKFL
jgi:hypothetical protein